MVPMEFVGAPCSDLAGLEAREPSMLIACQLSVALLVLAVSCDYSCCTALCNAFYASWAQNARRRAAADGPASCCGLISGARRSPPP